MKRVDCLLLTAGPRSKLLCANATPDRTHYAIVNGNIRPYVMARSDICQALRRP